MVEEEIVYSQGVFERNCGENSQISLPLLVYQTN